MSVRFASGIALGAALFVASATAAFADTYPSRPVRFVVPLAAGGGTDIVAAHLAAELFRSMSGADLTHVPYKGSGPAVTAIVAGEAAVGFYSASATAQHVRAGRLKALATTGARRSAFLPDLPMISESALPGYEASTWAGVLVPARTPATIVKRLHADLIHVLGQSEVRARIAALEFEPVGSSPAEFGATIERELVKWGKVVRDSGAKVE